MSVHDGQRIEEILHKSGFSKAPSPDGADVLVLTTCSVREKARQKVLSAIGRWKSIKARKPSSVIVVTGCVAQQDGQSILDDSSHVDLVLGPDHIYRVAELVDHVSTTGQRICLVGFDDQDSIRFLSLGSETQGRVSQYVTIQKGCDEGCAYCIVPSVRGPGRCRSSEEILKEINVFAQRGVREIVLLGQTVNSYVDGTLRFSDLLSKINDIKSVKRIRYESAHPKFLSPELITSHLELESLCEHLHLPVQSGSNAVLSRMGRGHTREQFLDWVGKARETCPDIGVSTDVFVGFPGEREEDFQQTLQLIDEVGFDAAFSFKYSPRPGTPAFDWEDDVPIEVKSDRLRRLQELQERKTSEYLRGLIGQTVEVLVEGESKTGGQLRGRSRRNTVVNIDLDTKTQNLNDNKVVHELMGSLVHVKITRSGGHSVMGEIVGKADGLNRKAEHAA